EVICPVRELGEAGLVILKGAFEDVLREERVVEEHVRLDVGLLPRHADGLRVRRLDGFDGLVADGAPHGHFRVAINASGEDDVLTGEWNAVLPAGARFDLPDRLHPAVRQEGPESILEGRGRLGEDGAKGALIVADGEARAEHLLEIGESGYADAAGREPVDEGGHVRRDGEADALRSGGRRSLRDSPGGWSGWHRRRGARGEQERANGEPASGAHSHLGD